MERFNQLANSVEEFTTSFLDPMRGDKGLREDFGDYLLDEVLDDAIEFEQKKVWLGCSVTLSMKKIVAIQ